MKTKHWTDSYHYIVRGLLCLVGCLLIACAVLLVILLTGGVPAGDASTGDETQETSQDTQAVPGMSTTYDHVILPETPDAGIAYQDKLIFVGDSITAHMVKRGGLTGGELTAQVWHTENNMLNLNSEVTSAKIIYPATKAKMTVAEAAALAKPEIMVITLGIDWGVAYLSEEDFKACYTALVQAIKQASPHTAVILQSILPVTARVSEEMPQISNQKIDICNTWVKAVADACDCPYLDTQSVLKGTDNALQVAYDNSDGIHLTAEAYAVMLQYIRTHAYIPE